MVKIIKYILFLLVVGIPLLVTFDSIPCVHNLNNMIFQRGKTYDFIIKVYKPLSDIIGLPVGNLVFEDKSITLRDNKKEFTFLLSIIKEKRKMQIDKPDIISGRAYPKSSSGTYLTEGSSIIKIVADNKWQYITDAERLLKWVEEHRRQWLLKWALAFLVLGYILNWIKNYLTGAE